MPSRYHSILIAESGATKTEWRYYGADAQWVPFQSVGLNPSNYTEEELLYTLQGIFSKHPIPQTLEALYFFGAGLRNVDTQINFQRLLRKALPQLGEIHLLDDLQAAVMACQRDRGIVAILGTGSNACYYEKGIIQHRNGGLGYLLGDEGSGMDLGRSLIQELLRAGLPPDIEKMVLAYLQKDAATLRNQVYQSDKPGLFFASLAPTLKHFEAVPALQQLIQNRFELFIQTHLLPLPHSLELPIDFIGSIAFHFRPYLFSALQSQGLQAGKIIRHPIDILPNILNSQKKL